MIAWLSGRLQRKTADGVIIDVAGVGYRVAVPLSTLGQLPETGEDISLHIHTYLREDTLSLYGFATELEKELFLMLTGVSGIGPKLALSVLSGLTVADFVAAVSAGEEGKLCSVPGVGKKTAARICLELKDKVRSILPEAARTSPASPAAAGPVDDAISALMNLGYKRAPAEDAVKRAAQHHADIRVEDLVRIALGDLSRK
jgi:Holliday junction DNA helicase RuvA